MSLDRVLASIDTIYDAGAGGLSWMSVGSSLATLVRARSASIMLREPGATRSKVLGHPNIPDEAVTEYLANFRQHDLWTRRAAALVGRPQGAPKIFMSGTLVPEDEFLRSEFWNGFGRHHGLRYVVGTVVSLGAAGNMPVGLQRPPGAAPFEEGDRQLLAAVLPHLRRAMQLRYRLSAITGPAAPQSSLGLAALDAMASGVLIVDAEMRVTLCNLAAERLAGLGSGFRLHREGGREPPRTLLRACLRADAAALTRLVRGTALGHAAGGALRLRAEDGQVATAALVMPLPARLAEAPMQIGGRVAGQALILLRHLIEPAAPRAEVLRALFGLSAAEAEVARAIVGGASKGSVAAARGSRETTVRTQIRAILAKTETSSLRDLERLLGGLTEL